MRTPIIDGRSIEQFIPADLRGMFYKNAIPQYKYAIHNGLDPYGFSTKGLVLYLPLWALEGSSFKSVDAYKETATVTDALWRPDGRLFSVADARIEIPASATQLDFTSSNFSIIAGIKPDAVNVLQGIFSRGLHNTDGYYYAMQATGFTHFYTSQSGAVQVSNSTNVFTATEWQTAAMSKDGATVTMLRNGIDVTDTAASHTNPATANRTAKVGIRDDLSWDFAGTIMFVLAYNRALSVAEHLHTHNVMKWRYQ